MKRSLLVLATMALVVAACGSSTSTGVASLEDAGAQPNNEAQVDPKDDRSTDESLSDFAACMRENGIEDFEDPVVDGDGGIAFGGGANGGGPGGSGGQVLPDPSELADLTAAFDACQEHMTGVISQFAGDGFDMVGAEDRMVEFAACMRDHGIDMDDPDFKDKGGMIDLGGFDLSNDETREAFEACQEGFGGLGGIGEGRIR